MERVPQEISSPCPCPPGWPCGLGWPDHSVAGKGLPADRGARIWTPLLALRARFWAAQKASGSSVPLDGNADPPIRFLPRAPGKPAGCWRRGWWSPGPPASACLAFPERGSLDLFRPPTNGAGCRLWAPQRHERSLALRLRLLRAQRVGVFSLPAVKSFVSLFCCFYKTFCCLAGSSACCRTWQASESWAAAGRTQGDTGFFPGS